MQGSLVFGVAAAQAVNDPPLIDDVAFQARAAFGRMDEGLECAKPTRAHVSFITIDLQDVTRDVDGFNAVWGEIFTCHSPARCCIGAALQGMLLVEITFCAERPDPL
ncbi:MAG: Rid family hydrolase [Pseudomonadota bacterium]